MGRSVRGGGRWCGLEGVDVLGGDGTQRRMAWEGAQQHGMYIIFSDEKEEIWHFGSQ